MSGIFLLCETCVKDYIIRLTNSITCDIIYITQKGSELTVKKSVYSLVLMDDVIKAVDEIFGKPDKTFSDSSWVKTLNGQSHS